MKPNPIRDNDLIFDIETSPLPVEHLEAIVPPFDPSDVTIPKNWTDPVKIKKKQEEARDNYMKDILDRAALEPMHCFVQAFTYCKGPTAEVEVVLAEALESEAKLLEFASGVLDATLRKSGRIIGFNIKRFDLTTLRRRWFIQRTPHPAHLLNMWKGRMNYHENVIDLQELWLGPGMFNQFAGQNLHKILTAVTGKGKTGDGADFAYALRENRKEAIEYVKTEVAGMRELAEVLVPNLSADVQASRPLSEPHMKDLPPEEGLRNDTQEDQEREPMEEESLFR